ncbi:hypothetical protein [Amycolatopsis sp. GA6-003]|uniref:hypothetical protein n=1 Tax=Amycolatopsis sp. GA6-003 TaxID=2652444 RepID=UPI003916F518
MQPEFTADDLYALVLDNALALKHGERPARDACDRRTAYLLDGIRGGRPARAAAPPPGEKRGKPRPPKV